MAVRKANARLRIRAMFDSGLVLGPGKADLLQAVQETGSISAAGKQMKMSYKRAWDLIDAMNSHFREPVVQASKGGSGGGGATLTPFGQEVLATYRRIQALSEAAVATELKWLNARLRPRDPQGA